MSNTYTIPTLADYQAADGATKRKMQSEATKEMKSALMADNGDLAKAIMLAQATWTPAKKEAVETDWNALVARRIASLRALADGIESGAIVATGTPEGFTFDESKVTAPVNSDDFEVSKLNLRVGNSKAAASDLQAAFDEVFADREVGDFLTCQEITNLAGLPSSGAVAARLFATSGCTLTGVTPVPATATTARGACKA